MSQQSWHPDGPAYGGQQSDATSPYAAQPAYAQEPAYGQQPGYGQQAAYQDYAQPAYAPSPGYPGQQPYGQPQLAAPGYAPTHPSWGQPPQVVNHGGWSRTLFVLAIINVVFGAFALVGGFAALATATTTDTVIVGSVLLVLGLAQVVACSFLIWLTSTGRRRADAGDPSRLRTAGIVATVFGAIALAGTVASVADAISSGTSPAGGLGGLLILVCGIQLIRITSSR